MPDRKYKQFKKLERAENASDKRKEKKSNAQMCREYPERKKEKKTSRKRELNEPLKLNADKRRANVVYERNLVRVRILRRTLSSTAKLITRTYRLHVFSLISNLTNVLRRFRLISRVS